MIEYLFCQKKKKNKHFEFDNNLLYDYKLNKLKNDQVRINVNLIYVNNYNKNFITILFSMIITINFFPIIVHIFYYNYHERLFSFRNVIKI